MLHLFKATVGTSRISQRIVRTSLSALWRLGLTADELRVRQLSLSGEKGRDNLTDMVRSRADAHYANPADQGESDSEVHGVLVRAHQNHVKK